MFSWGVKDGIGIGNTLRIPRLGGDGCFGSGITGLVGISC